MKHIYEQLFSNINIDKRIICILFLISFQIDDSMLFGWRSKGYRFPRIFFQFPRGFFLQASCSIANAQATNHQLADSLLVACWLALAGWRACWLHGWLARLFAASLACFLACCSDGWLACLLPGCHAWLPGWLACLLASILTSILAFFAFLGVIFLKHIFVCFFSSVWGTFPCYLLHFVAKTTTLLKFGAKICHLRCSSIFPWF